ncbi:MAG: hypothetical protein CVT48_00110 [Thermoplasmata archaeon HGW-Thermoplasmata-1]|nr:MAG: hypothetical protein CVT48_00110 [Thermoplasmata archaeon HGW-Thermoplasmata-1]
MKLGNVKSFCQNNRIFVLGLATSLMLIGLSLYVHFALQDTIYYRENGIEFRALVWRSYCLEAAALTIILMSILNFFPVSLMAVSIGLFDVLLHILGGMFDWYHTIDFWDHITHGLSHLAIVIGVAYWFRMGEDRGKVSISPLLCLSAVILISIGVGAIFEVREYAFSYVFDTIDQGGYDNTLQDIMFNIIGSLIGGIIMIAITSSPKSESGGRFVRYVGKNGRKLWIMAAVCLALIAVLLFVWYGKAITLDKW